MQDRLADANQPHTDRAEAARSSKILPRKRSQTFGTEAVKH